MKLTIVLCCLVGLAASKPVPQDDQQPPSSDFHPPKQSDFSSSPDTSASDFSAVGSGLSPHPSIGDSSRFGSVSTSSGAFGSDSQGAFISSSPVRFSPGGSGGGNEFLSAPDVSSGFEDGSSDSTGNFQVPVLDPSSGFGGPFPSSGGSGSPFILPQSGAQSFSPDGTQFGGDLSAFDSQFTLPGADLSATSPDSSEDSDDSSKDSSDNQSGGLFGFGKKK